MKSQRVQLTFFAGLLLIVSILAVLIFLPFLTVLAVSAVLAVLLGPLHRKLLEKTGNRKAIAALLTIAVVLVVIIIPLSFIIQRIFVETQGVYAALTSHNGMSFDRLSTWVESYGKKLVPDFSFDARARLADLSLFILGHLGAIFSGAFAFILKLVLSMFALFYFLKDGAKFQEHLMEISPLPRTEDEHIIGSMKSAINSIVLGSVVVALIQGLLTGIGFAIFGVPNATLWGTVAAIAALIPGVGTSLVWVPGVLYLFFFGGNFHFAWIGQLAWGVLGVGLVDNFIGPKIIEEGVNIHPLLILFSILGGVSFFGPEGFLLGPLVLSLLFALIRVYQSYARKNIDPTVHADTTILEA